MHRKPTSNTRLSRAAILVATTCLVLFAIPVARSMADDFEGELARFRPQWEVGRQWRLEVTPIRPGFAAASADAAPQPTIWEFTVAGRERLACGECFRVEGRPTVALEATPPLVFWAECDRLVLRQIELRVPTARGPKSLVERYDFPRDEAAPVIGLLNAVPIALPVFREANAKSARGFAYEVRSHADEGVDKEAESPGTPWRFSVRQQWKTTAPPAKGATTKAPDAPRRWTVELKSPLAHVRQEWQADRPWPVRSDNGAVVARLLDSPASR